VKRRIRYELMALTAEMIDDFSIQVLEVISVLKKVDVKAGDIVIRQGTPGNTFYLVRKHRPSHSLHGTKLHLRVPR
jgi:hypothetical protein